MNYAKRYNDKCVNIRGPNIEMLPTPLHLQGFLLVPHFTKCYELAFSFSFSVDNK